MPEKLEGSRYASQFTRLVTIDRKGDQSYEEICEFLQVACDLAGLYQAVREGMSKPHLKELVFRRAARLAQSAISAREDFWRKELSEAKHADLQKRWIKVVCDRAESFPEYEAFRHEFASKHHQEGTEETIEAKAALEFIQDVEGSLPRALARCEKKARAAALDVVLMKERLQWWNRSGGWPELWSLYSEEIKSVLFELALEYQQTTAERRVLAKSSSSQTNAQVLEQEIENGIAEGQPTTKGKLDREYLAKLAVEADPGDEDERFGPRKCGGLELCIVVSYNKGGQHDLERLAKMLKNKAKVHESRSAYPHGDPVSWYRNDPTGFANHVYRLRKRARAKGWWNEIPADYWQKYS